MTIVEVDGVYTDPQVTNRIYLTVGQRYSVLITTKETTERNFTITNTLDTNMFDHIPDGFSGDVCAYLVYDSTKSLPSVKPLTNLAPFDDFQLVPRDHQKAMDVDRQIIIKMNFINDTGVRR